MTGEALIIAQEAEYFQTNNLIKPREGKAPLIQQAPGLLDQGNFKSVRNFTLCSQILLLTQKGRISPETNTCTGPCAS